MKISELTEKDYHSFYQPYIDVLGDVELLPQLKSQLVNFPAFISSIPENKWHHSYAEGKWRVAEVLVHILDAERVFQYRALRIGRNDLTPLPGFDQNAYVPFSGAVKRTKEDVIEEYQAIRRSTIALFSKFSETDLKRVGTASNASISAGALGFLCCGHQKHHRNVLRKHYL